QPLLVLLLGCHGGALAFTVQPLPLPALLALPLPLLLAHGDTLLLPTLLSFLCAHVRPPLALPLGRACLPARCRLLRRLVDSTDPPGVEGRSGLRRDVQHLRNR